MSRTNEIRIRLSDDELAQLDEQRPGGMPRAVYLRSLIHRPPESTDVASLDEGLGMLTASARDGKVTAQVELVKALQKLPERPESDLLSRVLGDEGG